MDARELMIGNLVSCNDQTIKVTYHEIRIQTFSDHEHTNSYGVKFTGYEPIPLTEDWLLKFGFETNGKKMKIELELELEGDKKLFFVHSRGEIHIQYVHQLQNLYFALTGKELTIKS
jgi:hypothetical protein